MADVKKQLLRVRMLSLLRRMDPGERNWRAEHLRKRLWAWPPFQAARVVYAFQPLATEPEWCGRDLSPDKVWAFPRVPSDRNLEEVPPPELMTFHAIRSLRELTPGPLGAGEPHPDTPLAPLPELILIPGVAFDESGGRLGRGRGFYDRVLASLPGIRLGVAFDAQWVDKVPTATHDVGLHALATESGIWVTAAE